VARYTVNGSWPESVASALCPPIPYSPVSTTWGWSGVQGAPGTQAVNAPKPGVHSTSPNPLTARSFGSPDIIYPSIYTSTPDIAWRHVPVRPAEIMPVPAVNLFNMAGVAQRSRRVGGAYQVAQPAVSQTWPDLLGKRLGGK
jgi:hypothetical protein